MRTRLITKCELYQKETPGNQQNPPFLVTYVHIVQWPVENPLGTEESGIVLVCVAFFNGKF